MTDQKNTLFFFFGILLFILSIGYLEVFNQPYYFLQDDNYHQFMPIIIQGCRDFFNLGNFPEITPYQLGGMPTTSVGIYALTYPVTYISYAIAHFILHNEFATTEVFVVIHLAIGYILAYIGAKMCKANPMWACLFALGYSLSGFSLVVARSWYYMCTIVAFSPLLIIMMEYYKKNKVKSGYLVLFGFMFGILFNAGNAQMWIYFNMFYAIGILLLFFIKEIDFGMLLKAAIPPAIGIIIATPLLYVTYDTLSDISRTVYNTNFSINFSYLFVPYYFFEQETFYNSIFGISRINESFFNSTIINIFSIGYIAYLLKHIKLGTIEQYVLMILSCVILAQINIACIAFIIVFIYISKVKTPQVKLMWEKYIVPTLFCVSILCVLSLSYLYVAIAVITEIGVLSWLMLNKTGKKFLRANPYLFLALISFLFCLGQKGAIWSIIHSLPILNKFQHTYKMIVFVNLFLGLSGAMYISRIKRFKIIQTFLFLIGLVLIGFHLHFATAALCKYETVSYTSNEELFRGINDLDRYRIYSFSPERLDHPSFSKSQVNNFASLYKIYSIDAYDDNLETKMPESSRLYDKIYKEQPASFFYRHLLNKDTVMYLQEFGVKYIVNNNYASNLSEKDLKKYDIQRILKSQKWAEKKLNLIKKDGEIRIYELPNPKPLAFEKVSGLSLPISFDSTGALVDTRNLKNKASIIVNMIAHKNYKTYADGNLIPHKTDSYNRIELDIPENTSAVQIKYRSPWHKGFLLMIIELLVLFACCKGIKKWLWQEKN